MKKPSSMLTETEAAEQLRLSVAALRGWRLRGEGPVFVKLGRRAVRYRSTDLESFLRTSTVRPSTATVRARKRLPS
jgi:hypothetical protein